jgi:hypothetical protein
MIAAYGVDDEWRRRRRRAAARRAPHLNDNPLKYRLNIFARRGLAAMARGVEIG